MLQVPCWYAMPLHISERIHLSSQCDCLSCVPKMSCSAVWKLSRLARGLCGQLCFRSTAALHACDQVPDMQALGLTLEYGWGVNLGGGMHHASHCAGGGWCVYDDWMLAVRKLRQASNGRIQKAMMVDLDVHQVIRTCLCPAQIRA